MGIRQVLSKVAAAPCGLDQMDYAGSGRICVRSMRCSRRQGGRHRGRRYNGGNNRFGTAGALTTGEKIPPFFGFSCQVYLAMIHSA